VIIQRNGQSIIVVYSLPIKLIATCISMKYISIKNVFIYNTPNYVLKD